MSETTPPSEPSLLSRMDPTPLYTDPRVIGLVALAVGLAVGGAALGRRFYLAPIRATAAVQYQSHEALMRLYDLQVAYRGTNGTYANDLDSLLAGAPDAAKLRAQLAATVDMNTLTVVGDANRFRLEANLNDGQRTLVKFRGPLGGR